MLVLKSKRLGLSDAALSRMLRDAVCRVRWGSCYSSCRDDPADRVGAVAGPHAWPCESCCIRLSCVSPFRVGIRAGWRWAGTADRTGLSLNNKEALV